MKLSSYIVLFVSCFLVISCDFFNKTTSDQDAVARVNDSYLFSSEIDELFENTDFSLDSATVVNSYINDWATNRLLLDGALLNLSKEEQDKFEKLVQEYRTDLYIKLYKDRLIQQRLDSVVSDQEAAQFYDQNKENFKLNEELVKLRYIHLATDYNNGNEVAKLFINFKEEDKVVLDSIRLQFKNYFLNDSTWVRRSVVQNSIQPIDATNADKLLKKTNFLQLRDSLGLYLIAVKETLSRNDIAPLTYVRPTIDQIIRNKRKLTLTKQLEKEIKDDAIKNKKFEIYN
ncbi:peptidyl-prolyl cis-trans isomerase [uncultured Dokdonia sp.]|uniref:peptidyl-prolyl cis-trans isomerase n=1 Tax=uncultured Dokdonia sp. TaxID=575653 RepID=UPI00263019EA|nr:peptidyl-prolyl cis-trans isomerase [uncultured Dokdonia sp.]